MWELDELSVPVLLGYVRALPPDPLLTGVNFLPNREIDDIDFEYTVAAQKQVIMAGLQGFDAEAQIVGQQAAGQLVRGSLPPIKIKTVINEKAIIKYTTPRVGTRDQAFALDKVYGQVDDLVAGVQQRVEWLRIQALSQPLLTYNEGGRMMQFDYEFNKHFQFDLPTQKDAAGTDLSASLGPVWSDFTNSTPISDLLFMSQTMQETGFPPATIVMSNKAKTYLLRSKSIILEIRGKDSLATRVTSTELAGLLTEYELPAIETYDALVNRENADGTITSLRPLDDSRAILLPSISVGETIWGPTAESRRALIMSGISEMQSGVFVNTAATDDPVAEWIKAAALALPVIPQAHLVGQVELF